MDHDNLMLTAPTNGIWAAPNAMLLQGPDFAQNHVNTQLLFTLLPMVKRDRSCTTPYLSNAHLPTTSSPGSTPTSIGTQPSLP